MSLVDIGSELVEVGTHTRAQKMCGGVRRLAGGTWVAWACLPREGRKPLYLVATSDERIVRAAIMGRYRAAGVNVGAWGFLKKIKNIAKSIARSKVIGAIGKAVKAVVKNPIVAKAVGLAGFIPGVGTALGAAFNATKAAATMLEKAKAGSAPARAQIQALTRAANAGSPAARKSVAVLRATALGRGRVIAAQRGQARGRVVPGVLYQGRPVMVGDAYADGLASM